MPIAAQVHAKPGSGFAASEEQLAFLRGSLGVLESCAAMAGIHCIEGVSVQDARQHFCGQRRFERDAKGKSTAKDAIMDTARMLGVDVATDHEGDAFACWWFAGAKSNPRLAHLSQPLFGRINA